MSLELHHLNFDHTQPLKVSASMNFPPRRASLAATRRVALVGNFAPRKCGIATFTTDVFEKLGEHHPEVAVDVYALDDSREKFDMVWQDRIRMISPEALAQARSMLIEVGDIHDEMREMPPPPAAGSGVSSRVP